MTERSCGDCEYYRPIFRNGSCDLHKKILPRGVIGCDTDDD